MADKSPFDWQSAPDEKINFGWRDSTILHDLERFWHLMKRGVTFQGLNADLLDGKDASDFGNVGMDPGSAGPQCNALCFGPPLNPGDPGFGTTVPIQDSGVPTSNIVTAPNPAANAGQIAVSTGANKEVVFVDPSGGDVSADGNLTPGVIPVASDVKEITDSPLRIEPAAVTYNENTLVYPHDVAFGREPACWRAGQ
jgi:hypothetical protein